MMYFNAEYNKRIEIANDIIKSYIPIDLGVKSDIIKAMKYSLMAGGKRIRPILIMEMAKKFNYDYDKISPFMAAIEFIHTYSLVHDDLPAMDNDDYRRGKLTTHKKYGHAMGILAGDALLNYAFEILISSLKEFENKDEAINAMEVLARNAGVGGMIGGQACDVINDGKEIDEDTILYIYENKTSALIEASMVIGAILGGANEDEISDIEDAGSLIGMAFQIKDDILDIEGDEEKLGKPLHSDEANNKTTYVTINGLEKSKNTVDDYMKEAKEILDNVGCKNEFLEELLNYLVYREN